MRFLKLDIRTWEYFVCSFLCMSIAFSILWQVFQPPCYRIPKGPIEVGAGRDLLIKETELIVSVPNRHIEFQVAFNFTDSKEYSIYVLMPFIASTAKPFFTYQHSSPHYEENSVWGNLSFPPENFHVNSTLGSSGAKVIFKPNSTYPFIIGDDFSLGMSFNLSSSLIAIDIPPWGAIQTVILTFFGHTSVDKNMEDYREGTTLTIQHPFVVNIELPSDTYVSSDTYPSPIEYYVRGNVRWVMFLPNFLEGRFAQTVSCSFKNPTSEKWKDVLIFFGGVFVAIGGSFLAEPMKNRIERKEEKKELEKKEEDKEKLKTKSVESKRDEEQQRKKYINSPLLLEYEMTQQMHNHYGRINWEIASILVAGSLAIIGFSLQSPIITKKPVLFVGIAVAVTLIVFAWYLLFKRISQLADIHIARLLQIEKELNFHQHEYVHNANERGHLIIDGKCYELSGLRGRHSVYFLMFLLVVVVWVIAAILLWL